MARAGYRIFDADTHIIEPAEPIEAYLSPPTARKLAALGPLVGARPAKARHVALPSASARASIACLGSRERVAPPPASRAAQDGGTPWDVRWQGPPFPSDRVSFDPHARVQGHGHRGRGREHGPALGRRAVVLRVWTTSRSSRRCTRRTTASSPTTARPIPIG